MLLELLIKSTPELDSQLISKYNLGPILYKNSREKVSPFLNSTTDYNMILTNKFENCLSIPISAYGMDDIVAMLKLTFENDIYKLKELVPLFYKNFAKFGFPYPYREQRVLELRNVFVTNGKVTIWS